MNAGKGRRLLSTFAMVVVAAGAVVLTASPAGATTASSDCTARAYGPMCFYYASNYQGARAAITTATPDLYSYTFSNTGSGAGTYVANNAGSGINEDTRCVARIWYDANYTGIVFDLNYHGYIGDRDTTLDDLNNNNRSLSWRDCF
jgi:peptidase inhibitor family I36